MDAWPGGCACQPQAACVKGETYESKTPADVCGVAVVPLIVAGRFVAAVRLIVGCRFVAGCTSNCGRTVCGGLHGWWLYVVCAMVDALREVAQALTKLLPCGRGEAACAAVAVDAVELVVEP